MQKRTARRRGTPSALLPPSAPCTGGPPSILREARPGRGSAPRVAGWVHSGRGSTSRQFDASWHPPSWKKQFDDPLRVSGPPAKKPIGKDTGRAAGPWPPSLARSSVRRLAGSPLCGSADSPVGRFIRSSGRGRAARQRTARRERGPVNISQGRERRFVVQSPSYHKMIMRAPQHEAANTEPHHKAAPHNRNKNRARIARPAVCPERCAGVLVRNRRAPDAASPVFPSLVDPSHPFLPG
jgi:hypothetical protein